MVGQRLHVERHAFHHPEVRSLAHQGRHFATFLKELMRGFVDPRGACRFVAGIEERRLVVLGVVPDTQLDLWLGTTELIHVISAIFEQDDFERALWSQ